MSDIGYFDVGTVEADGPLEVRHSSEDGAGLWQRIRMYSRTDLAKVFSVAPKREYPPAIGQRQAPHGSQRYNPVGGTQTFAQAGCLVTSVYWMARYAGYAVDIVEFAAAIAQAGAFVGDELLHPSRVSAAFGRLQWRYDRWVAERESSFVNWQSGPVDLEVLAWILERQPVVAKVDFKPATRAIDQHFVVLVRYDSAPATAAQDDDCLMMDPWTGEIGSLVGAYFNEDWRARWPMSEGASRVARILQGLRVWEVK